MSSNLFNQLTQQMPSNNLFSMIKNSDNPEQLLYSLANTNSIVRNVLDEVNANGGDAKSLFYKKVEEMGIDPNFILNQIR